MLQPSVASASPCGDATSVQHIAQSLEYYNANARFDVPKTAVDHMDAMCAIAKCSNQAASALLDAHVRKRKTRKDPAARYHFGAALEAHALDVQTKVSREGDPHAVRQSVSFVNTCLLRAERNILVGFALDPLHTHADAYFAASPKAACWTLSNVASRMALASLQQPRLTPAVHVPFCTKPVPAAPLPQPVASPPAPAAPPPARDPAAAKRMLPPPPRPPALAKMARMDPLPPGAGMLRATSQEPETIADNDFFQFLETVSVDTIPIAAPSGNRAI